MKKIGLALLVILISSVSLYAYGVLTGSKTNGTKKICFYSDGSALTVSASEVCPVSVD